MNNFTYYNPCRIVFGKGAELKTASELQRLGARRVLLHYGGGHIKTTGLYETVVGQLREAGIFFAELPGAQPNPRLSLVREGIELARREKLDFILAVGGGSVIDSAKGIAAGALYDGDVWDFYTKGVSIAAALPIGSVLTIPAAGSETSAGSVVTDDHNDLKRDAKGECLIPRFAILNPELTYTLPPYQTACGVSDILAHLMERYFTPTDHTAFTDELLEGAMRAILRCGPEAIERPRDYDARAEVMLIATQAHGGYLDMGRVGDWGSHMIEHELSGMFDVAHGAGLCIVFPAWIKAMAPQHPDRFARFARAVMGVASDGTAQEQIGEGVARLEAFYKELGMPTRLGEIGADASHIAKLAASAVLGRPSIGNLKKLGAADVEAILRLAL